MRWSGNGPPVEPLYRLVTTVLDPNKAPAHELAALYAERWEVEIRIREIKIYQGRPNVALRIRKPDGVLQELYGFLTVPRAFPPSRTLSGARGHRGSARGARRAASSSQPSRPQTCRAEIPAEAPEARELASDHPTPG
ncbi:transposase [Limnochorda pilosa]|uniref:transposase n=1 Tax=Limnochorda pilosa TaxID=1555112 RepID=UPI00130EA487